MLLSLLLLLSSLSNTYIKITFAYMEDRRRPFSPYVPLLGNADKHFSIIDR